jgi:hypothetical protein
MMGLAILDWRFWSANGDLCNALLAGQQGFFMITIYS